MTSGQDEKRLPRGARWTLIVLGSLATAFLAFVGAVAAVFVVDWIRAEVKAVSIEGFWVPLLLWILFGGVVAAAVVLFAMSLFRTQWRHASWGWLFGFRLLSRKAREDLEAKGYQVREAALVRERASVRKPAWSVEPTSFGPDWFWLRNYGYGATEVKIEPVDTRFFVPSKPAYWGTEQVGDDSPGASQGKQFQGRLTRRGRDEGVSFRVTWLDANGDQQEEVIQMDKRPSLTRPQWLIDRPKQGKPGDYALFNLSSSIAKAVRIDCPSALCIPTSQVEWDALDGPAAELFTARLTDQGKLMGVPFQIFWTDAYLVDEVSEFQMAPPKYFV
ncbi:hypothetical protein [Microbacterium enclense]|uniref:hypothetical protein n=1 Tax=Microbacterium enclense TaxID=993073 RepID=UPI00341E450E